MVKYNDTQLKEKFFEGLFEERVIKYKQVTDKKYVDFALQCNNESLSKFFNKLFSKYKGKVTYSDFMNECMYWSNVAIQRFNVRDEGSWEGILYGSDKANIGRLITNIKTTVEYEIINYVNDDTFYTKKKIDGVEERVRMKFNICSLDALMYKEDSEAVFDFIGEENGYLNVKEGYSKSHFIKWFEENKETILTKGQCSLLNKLHLFNSERDSYTENDIKEITGVDSKYIKRKMERINSRVLKAWDKENRSEKTQLQMYKEEELALWTEFYLLQDSEPQEMNKLISEWLFRNFENERASNMVYDHITAEESIEVTKAYRSGEVIPSKILYKVMSAVETRMDELSVMETHSSPFYMKPHENSGWTKEKHKEYSKYLKGFIKSDCNVYNSEGKLIRVEEWKPFKNSKNIIVEVLPTGVLVKKENNHGVTGAN